MKIAQRWQHLNAYAAACFDHLDRHVEAHRLEPEALRSLSYAVFYHDVVHDVQRHGKNGRCTRFSPGGRSTRRPSSLRVWRPRHGPAYGSS
ncbi:MAG: hypothetical protein ACOC2D_01025 [Spirochaetota bacterium]